MVLPCCMKYLCGYSPCGAQVPASGGLDISRIDPTLQSRPAGIGAKTFYNMDTGMINTNSSMASNSDVDFSKCDNDFNSLEVVGDIVVDKFNY